MRIDSSSEGRQGLWRSLACAAQHLALGTPIHVGLNDWYIATGATANRVLKVRGGIVREIGVATKALTTGRAAQRRFLSAI